VGQLSVGDLGQNYSGANSVVSAGFADRHTLLRPLSEYIRLVQRLGYRGGETKPLGWYVHAQAVEPFADGENDGEYVELVRVHKLIG
jgi:hypothetical protein